MSNKKEVILCHYCGKKITKGQKVVEEKESYYQGKIFYDKMFHSECGIKRFNDAVERKVNAYAQSMMKMVMPKIKEAMTMIT